MKEILFSLVRTREKIKTLTDVFNKNLFERRITKEKHDS